MKGTLVSKVAVFAASFAVMFALWAVLLLFVDTRPAHAAVNTFEVNSTADTADANTADDACDVDTETAGNQCTLRAAIQQANATANDAAGPDAINFNISGTGVQTINVGAPPPGGTTGNGPLPPITDPVIINGYSQPGASANTLAVGNNAILLVELNGTNAGNDGFFPASGLKITAANSTVKGLVINSFGGNGIYILGASATGNKIEGNFIGTNASGTADFGNGEKGVFIDNDARDNTVGGTTAGARNVISGNNGAGVYISRNSGNKVEGNRIGTDATGTAALSNSGGVVLNLASNTAVGGTAEGAGNLISGNNSGLFNPGVVISGGSSNSVQGNLIGTSADGTAALGNSGDGVNIGGGSSNNTIGGAAPGAGNVISGNNENGVLIYGSSLGNKVEGNRIGTDAAGNTDLGNSQDGVFILQGDNNTVGGTTTGAGNVISGNNENGVVVVGSSNKVEGNRIGTDATGTAALSNGGSSEPGSGNGVFITPMSSNNNTVGGTTTGARNVISGNSSNGVVVGGSGNQIQGNYIGIDASGTKDLGNIQEGVRLQASVNSTIGGAASGAGNVISGNNGNGILVTDESSGSKVEGNYIGTDATGTAALGNGVSGVFGSGNGVFITPMSSNNNTVGGTTTGARNVISGNSGNGVYISQSNNHVQGNYIGTDAAGNTDLGNSRSGVYLEFGNNAIGGTTTGAGNVISGNNGSGVEIWASNNKVEGNLIGTNATGTAAVGNSQSGVNIRSGVTNTIGGTAAGAGNVISGNNGSGVVLPTEHHGANNRILSNSIYANAGLGIDLGNDGVTLNDDKDPDSGPNRLQNFPVLTSAVVNATGSTTIKGTLNSTPSETFTVQFFLADVDPSNFGEGKKYLGEKTGVMTDANGNASFSFTTTESVEVDQFVTATATSVPSISNNSANDTSEFSEFEQVTADTIVPRVTNVTPAAGATRVAPTANVTATFSEAMNEESVEATDPATGKPTTFTLRRAGTSITVAATVTYNATTKKAILNPNTNLRLGATYIATVTTEAKDLAGNALDQNPTTAVGEPKVWKFTIRT